MIKKCILVGEKKAIANWETFVTIQHKLFGLDEKNLYSLHEKKEFKSIIKNSKSF